MDLNTIDWREDDIDVRKFGVLAIFALLFAVIAVFIALYFQGHVTETAPKCGDCQYVAGGKCFDYECCEDEHCLENQTCNGHICYDLNCPPDKIEDHACIYEEPQLNLTNVTTPPKPPPEKPECASPLDCLDNQTCEKSKCVPVKCEEDVVILNHTCTGKMCIEDSDCNGSSACLDSICWKIECEYCQYAANHSCLDYECCDYADCGFEETCKDHHCLKLNCTGDEQFFAGNCIVPECMNDSDCNDGKSNTIDTCTDPGKPYSKCKHDWLTINFTGDTTLTLHLGQNAYYLEKRSGITLLEFMESDYYFWEDRAKFDYSLHGRHESEWIVKPPPDTNATIARAKYWANLTVGIERLSVILNGIDETKQTATVTLKYSLIG